MSHLDDTQLARFRDGLLPSDALREAVRHVNTCADCRRRAEAILGTNPSLTEPGAPPDLSAPGAAPGTESIAPAAGTQELSSGGVAQARAASLERGTGLGRYVVLDKLGEGGMGVVYAAYDPDLDRKVALKLLRSGPASESVEKRARLMREAQAMARLSHRNVISVYDVGTLGDQIFVAMEYVDGGTLGAWMRHEVRPWREVLRSFLRAGRGLAAAHAAGLVHRDFKPDNVLLGKDGRVLVTDFGLARPSLSELASPTGNSTGLDAPITQPGVLLGTPAYMAPEQLERKEADERSDQFAFCVALYEALFGFRPFPGRGLAELKPHVLQGKVRPPPPESPVPAYVRRAVLKGLSVKPEDRFRTMDDLLATLRRDPRALWWRWLGAAAALVCLGLGVGGVLAARAHAAPMCQGAAARLANVWDGPRKEAMRAAFLATGKPYAQASFDAVAQALDLYAAAWVAGHTDACEATRVRREQSEALMEARMLCLDRRRQELDALAGLFAAADAQMVEQAVEASRALTPVKGCADLASLAAGSLLPEEAALRPQVEEVRKTLARVKALQDAGRYADGIALARTTLETARGLRYRPLEAEAQFALGELLAHGDDFKGAERALSEAVLAATAGRHPLAATRAWIRLVAVEAELNAAQAHAYSRQAAAALEGYGHDDVLEALLASNTGSVYLRQGDYAKAKEHYRRALVLNEKALGPDDPGLAIAYSNYANTLDLLGQYDEALAYDKRALVLKEKSLGPVHPAVAKSLGNLSVVLTELGRYAEAREALTRALAIFEKSMGEGPRVAITLHNLGDVYTAEGRYKEALASYERSLEIRKRKGGITGEAAFTLANLGNARILLGQTAQGIADERAALAIVEKEQGKEFTELSGILLNLASGLLAQRKLPEARAALGRALVIAEKGFGAESLRAGDIRHVMAEALAIQRKPREALAQYQKALALREKAMGADYQGLAEDLTGIGESWTALGTPAQGIAPLERALKLREARPGDAGELARTRFALARALRESGREPARARALAEQAVQGFAQAGELRRRELADARAWMKAHR